MGVFYEILEREKDRVKITGSPSSANWRDYGGLKKGLLQRELTYSKDYATVLTEWKRRQGRKVLKGSRDEKFFRLPWQQLLLLPFQKLLPNLKG